MKTLTIFSAPKPFLSEHIVMIQRNAIKSWLQLGNEVEVILIGNEEGIGDEAKKMGVKHIHDIKTNHVGTPLVSSIFRRAREYSDGNLLAYVNADVLLMENFLASAKILAKKLPRFLAVGQRYDLAVGMPILFSTGWQERIWEETSARGQLHPRGGSDYFIYPRSCFRDIPDFAIGRAGWDNWMIYEARQKGWPVVDTTQAIDIIHQDHDYGHLPGGQAHYRLPESSENVRLAGGPRTIFTLLDANRTMKGKKIHPVEMTWAKFWREVEIYPLVKLHSQSLTRLFFTIFHPKRAYQDYRKETANNGQSKRRR